MPPPAAAEFAGTVVVVEYLGGEEIAEEDREEPKEWNLEEARIFMVPKLGKFMLQGIGRSTINVTLSGTCTRDYTYHTGVTAHTICTVSYTHLTLPTIHSV